MTLKTWVGIAGIAGFLLSLANAVQTWRRNRPIVSVHPGQHPTEAIEIEIENPSLRPITIIKSQCFPSELHQVWDPDRPLRAQIVAATYNAALRCRPRPTQRRSGAVIELHLLWFDPGHGVAEVKDHTMRFMQRTQEITEHRAERPFRRGPICGGSGFLDSGIS